MVEVQGFLRSGVRGRGRLTSAVRTREVGGLVSALVQFEGEVAYIIGGAGSCKENGDSGKVSGGNGQLPTGAEVGTPFTGRGDESDVFYGASSHIVLVIVANKRARSGGIVGAGHMHEVGGMVDVGKPDVGEGIHLQLMNVVIDSDVNAKVVGACGQLQWGVPCEAGCKVECIEIGGIQLEGSGGGPAGEMGVECFAPEER